MTRTADTTDTTDTAETADTADVTLRLDQSAQLGRAPRGTAPVETHRHLPGTVLRGALAAAWIRESGPPQQAPPDRRDAFLHLFEGPVRYGPLFDPASDVVPRSVLRCKYRPEPACHGFASDRAADDASPASCTVCGGRTEPGSGEVEFFGPRAVPDTVQTTRVRLTEDERAEEGRLFTRRALAAARTLAGRITTDDGSALPGWLLRGHRLRVGARRSTSGAARYRPAAPAAVSPAVPPYSPDALAPGLLLTLRLLSPALLVDAAGRPAGRPDTTVLGELLETGPGVTVERSWTRHEQVGGWHALTNLPKPSELAVAAGSVFRLRLPAPPTARGLARLAAHGLGLRRAEGFGWLAYGPWTPPAGTDTDTAPLPSTGTKAARLTRELHQLTANPAWFQARLRDCLHGRRRGEAPDPRFLDLPQAEVLHRLRDGALGDELRRLVTDPDRTADLEDTVRALEARLREDRDR
ncbi:type III-B CRISPR module-associated Cmr3 family protein [Streptomyces aidingensis]|uniref:CRISPR-associated protein Csx10 n=1 Tax=Streptomyces aidingensis TaxID=910347 RepID=A0A1I1NI91_9ACTN|nr:type III-B CRISPR module-associated Cmr3 family protein [Streptomyces aidingensis]SFC97359.1 CRISPR-associated protein Csx10 [Streptomyces aidingensis]